jgi:phosphate transport system permease protein
MSPQSFTGRGRRRQTRRSVLIAEWAARILITVGGLGTILAVTMIVAFLVWVVAPLFRGAEFEKGAAPRLAGATEAAPIAAGVDEYQVMGWALDGEGVVRAWRLDTGESLREERLFGSTHPSAISLPIEGGRYAVGFGDGSVRIVRIDFEPDFVDSAQDEQVRTLVGDSDRATWNGGVVQRTPEGQYRTQSLDVEVGEPIEVGAHSAITALDGVQGNGTTRVCAYEEDGGLHIADVERSENIFTGERTSSVVLHDVPWKARADGAAPAHALLAGAGDRLLVAWRDGVTRRYDARDIDHVRPVEEFDLVDGEGTLDAVAFLIGRGTLVTGDSRGRLRAWFGTKPDGAKASDGERFVQGHDLSAGGAPIRWIGASARGRAVASGAADGRIAVHHVTSGKSLFETQIEDGEAIDAVLLAPKDDGLVAFSAGRVASWHVDLLHPEVTFAALFRPVWYENYPRPEHVWQSSSGTDDFEPKLGLWPLIFGTIKATFYSMLFGVPLALLAAVYTSEFLHPRLRTPLKSMVEIMASLPSVVLGFLAAIVFAPYVQGYLAQILASFVCVPFALLLGARIWSLLPPKAYVQMSGTPRFVAIACMLPIGVALAWWIGPIAERALFEGDLELWLHGGFGRAFGGWLILLIPAAAATSVFVSTRVIDPWWRGKQHKWSRAAAGRYEFIRFGLGVVAALGLAAAVAYGLDVAGFDARGGVLDTYVQRNAMIVGFVMGFAIVPIVYTLAEDALASVPGHLRLASLGAGATPWQTATRVVIPTAMSGLFSAVMVGLGRAVGETMIVLMATGNTPVMSWNIFDGFRTLSANIAVELPEAVKNSTHYRTLFLAALCLFAMTFVLNTVAEVVRQRFRKRAYQL